MFKVHDRLIDSLNYRDSSRMGKVIEHRISSWQKSTRDVFAFIELSSILMKPASCVVERNLHKSLSRYATYTKDQSVEVVAPIAV